MTVIENQSVICTFDDHRPYKSVTYAAVVTSMMVALWLFGCVTNGLVLTLIVRRSTLRTVTNVLLANLAIISLLFFLCAVSISIWVTANRGYWHSYGQCQINGFTSIALTAATWFNHAVVNIEQYVKVISPLRKRFTMTTAVISCVFIWIVSIGFGVLALLSPNGYNITNTQLFCGPGYQDYKSLFMTLFISAILVSLAAMLFSQFGVYRVHQRIHNHSRQRAQPIGIFINTESQNQNIEYGENNPNASQSTNNLNESQGTGNPVNDDSKRKTNVSSLSFSMSSSSSDDRNNTAQNVKMALAIFQSSLVYILLYVLNICTLMAVHHFYPQDEAKCSSEGTPSFYYGAFHVLLFLLVMATAPLIYIRGNTQLKKALWDSLKKFGCLKCSLLLHCRSQNT